MQGKLEQALWKFELAVERNDLKFVGLSTFLVLVVVFLGLGAMR